MTASGAGFNPTLDNAVTDVKLDINSLVYQKKILKDITADVTLSDGNYDLVATSDNSGMRFRVEGAGTLAPDLYTFDITGNLREIDLHELGISPEVNNGKMDITLRGSASRKNGYIMPTYALTRWNGHRAINIFLCRVRSPRHSSLLSIGSMPAWMPA